MSIGKLINSRRVELGLTLEDVGNVVGVSKSTVKKWEDGFIENMRRDKIAKLASVLHLSPVSLITGEIVYENEDKYNFYLSPREKEIILAYRSQPSLHVAVDRLLGIESDSDEKKKRA